MVPGSIPGGVTGFFSDISPSDRSMALGSTQPIVKMSTRNIHGGKGGRCVRLTSPAEYHEILEPKPPGTLWATPGLLRDSFYSNHQALKDSVKSTGQRTTHSAGVSQWLGICHFCQMDYVKHFIAGNIELCIICILHATLGSHKAKTRLHGVQNVHCKSGM